MTPMMPKEEMRRSGKRPQPPSGLSTTHSRSPLSANAFRAKVNWEAKYGEPCPYARSVRGGPCYPNMSRAGTAKMPICTKRNNDSARLCNTASSPWRRTSGGRWSRLRSGFDGAFEDSVCREHDVHPLDSGPTGSAKFIDKATGSSSSAMRRTMTTRCGARRFHQVVTGDKPGQRRTTPSLLEIHQRVINAALLELSQPHDMPFENLGERLGGEPDEQTYREGSIRVRGGKVLGGLPDCTIAVNRPSTAEERPASASYRDQLRSSRRKVDPGLRARHVGVVERTILPPFKENYEAWKIPLLRSGSPTTEDRSWGFYDDTFGDAEECPLDREFSSAADKKDKHRHLQGARTGSGSAMDRPSLPNSDTSIRRYSDHGESSSDSSSQSAISCTWSANDSPRVQFSTTSTISGVGQQPAADLMTAGTTVATSNSKAMGTLSTSNSLIEEPQVEHPSCIASEPDVSRLNVDDHCDRQDLRAISRGVVEAVADNAIHFVAFSSSDNDRQLERDPPGTALVLPHGLLADIAVGRKCLKPASDGPETAAQDKLLGLSPPSELEMEEMEASDRAAQLRELEDLIHHERLDQYNPAAFSRGALYGEGKHALVYRATAKNTTVVNDVITVMASAVAIDVISTALVLTTYALAPETATAELGTASAAISATMAAIVTENIIDATVAFVAAEAGGSEQAPVLAAKEFRNIRPSSPAVSFLRDARREIRMHLCLRHCDRIVKLQGVWLTPRITLLFDPMEGGSLHQFIREKYGQWQGFDRDEGGIESGSTNPLTPHPAFLVADVADSLVTLHRAGIIHRDVKTRNVMMFQPKQAPATAEDVHGGKTPAKSDAGPASIVEPISEGSHRGQDLTVTWEAKLGDLGSAALIPCETGAAALTEEVGTSGSTAPEVRLAWLI